MATPHGAYPPNLHDCKKKCIFAPSNFYMYEKIVFSFRGNPLCFNSL
jgi:hypothetical protein